VPIEQAAMQDRTIIEWDKDDIEALGMLKIDLLSLGMLTALRKGIDLVNGDRAALGAGGVDSRLDDAPPVRRDLADVSPLQQPSRPPFPSPRTPVSGHTSTPLHLCSMRSRARIQRPTT
jgi:hypothetical protein